MAPPCCAAPTAYLLIRASLYCAPLQCTRPFLSTAPSAVRSEPGGPVFDRKDGPSKTAGIFTTGCSFLSTSQCMTRQTAPSSGAGNGGIGQTKFWLSEENPGPSVPPRDGHAAPKLGGRAVVIGAGMGGLAAAGALAKYFERVDVLERDRLTASVGSRSGTPQDRHPHGLLAGGLRALDQIFPSFKHDLAAAGAVPPLRERSSLSDRRSTCYQNGTSGSRCSARRGR